MHDNRTHPLLEQVPLTVSPFVKLPTATTLPYTYKPMPNSLPPSALGITATADTSSSAADDQCAKPKYVVSTSGHAAHPDDIIASCRALQAHVAKLQAEAETELRELEERIRARELAEKRRLAPGWLDSDVRVLEPERKSVPVSEAPSNPVVLPAGGGGAGSFGGGNQMQFGGGGYGYDSYGHGNGHGPEGVSEMAVPDEGGELDRAFGGLGLGQSQGQSQGQGR